MLFFTPARAADDPNIKTLFDLSLEELVKVEVKPDHPTFSDWIGIANWIDIQSDENWNIATARSHTDKTCDTITYSLDDPFQIESAQ